MSTRKGRAAQDFGDYYKSLSKLDRAKITNEVGVGPRYIRNKLLRGEMMPQSILIAKLSVATKGKYTPEDLVVYFIKINKSCKSFIKAHQKE